MANGDTAASHGLAVWPGTQDRRLGYDDLNIRGDEIAAVMDSVALKLDADKVLVQQADPGDVPDGTLWVSWS
jgi:hypothetical protein